MLILLSITFQTVKAFRFLEASVGIAHYAVASNNVGGNSIYLGHCSKNIESESVSLMAFVNNDAYGGNLFRMAVGQLIQISQTTVRGSGDVMIGIISVDKILFEDCKFDQNCALGGITTNQVSLSQDITDAV